MVRKQSLARHAMMLFLGVSAAFAPACAPVPGDDIEQPSGSDGEELQSSITYDSNGRAYEGKYERMTQTYLSGLAQDADGFRQVLVGAYGEGFDPNAAEGLRQKMAAGDFSWTPPVQLVAPEQLGRSPGAYSKETKMVYLSENVPGSSLRAFIYLEEIGHHIDTLITASDTPGDEGALFRMAAIGQPAVPELHGNVLGDDHVGTMVVGGQSLPVEFAAADLDVDTVSQSVNKSFLDIKAWFPKDKKSFTVTEALTAYALPADPTAAVMKTWLANGAGKTAEEFVKDCQNRTLRVTGAIFKNIDALAVLKFNLSETAMLLAEAGRATMLRDCKAAGAAFFVALAKVRAVTPAGELTGAVLEKLSSLQEAIGVEPDSGRKLQGDERKLLDRVFQKADKHPWMDEVTVKEGFAGIFTLGDGRGASLGATIYLPAKGDTDAQLVHEATHVWQWHKAKGGSEYKTQPVLSLHFGGMTDWRARMASGVAPLFSQFTTEQQSSFLQNSFEMGMFGRTAVLSLDLTAIGTDYQAFLKTVKDGLAKNEGAASWANRP